MRKFNLLYPAIPAAASRRPASARASVNSFVRGVIIVSIISAATLLLTSCGGTEQNPTKSYTSLAGAVPQGTGHFDEQTYMEAPYNLVLIDTADGKAVDMADIQIIQGETKTLKVKALLSDPTQAINYELVGSTDAADVVSISRPARELTVTIRPKRDLIPSTQSFKSAPFRVEFHLVGKNSVPVEEAFKGITTVSRFKATILKDHSVPVFVSVTPERKKVSATEKVKINIVVKVDNADSADDVVCMPFQHRKSSRTEKNIELEHCDGTIGLTDLTGNVTAAGPHQFNCTFEFDSARFLANFDRKKCQYYDPKVHGQRDVEPGTFDAAIQFKVYNQRSNDVASEPKMVTLFVTPNDKPGTPILGTGAAATIKQNEDAAKSSRAFTVETNPLVGDVSLVSASVGGKSVNFDDKGKAILTGILSGEANIACEAASEVTKPNGQSCNGKCVMSCNLYWKTDCNVAPKPYTINLIAAATVGGTNTVKTDRNPLQLKINIEKNDSCQSAPAAATPAPAPAAQRPVVAAAPRAAAPAAPVVAQPRPRRDGE